MNRNLDSLREGYRRVRTMAWLDFREAERI